MKNNQVDVNKYYQPGEIDSLKQHVLSGTTYNIKQEKLLFATQKLKQLRKK